MNRIHRSSGLRSSTTLLQATTAEEQLQQTPYVCGVEAVLLCAALLPPCGYMGHSQPPFYYALLNSGQTRHGDTDIFFHHCDEVSFWCHPISEL